MNEKKQSETSFSTTVRLIIQIIFLILLAAAIVSLIVAIITISKNKDLISKDPLVYGMGVHNFTSCICYDNIGKKWESSGGGFVHEEIMEEWPMFSPSETSFNASKIEVIGNGDG